MKPATPIKDRFERQVMRGLPSGCWLWTGSLTANGYGQIGRDGGGGVTYAHRASYEMHIGPIPDGLHVRHRCDNPPCVNPMHLELGTHADNMRDMASRGRASNQNATKTHCRRGHPFDEQNTYSLPGGGRRCIECNRRASREYQRRKRASYHLTHSPEPDAGEFDITKRLIRGLGKEGVEA